MHKHAEAEIEKPLLQFKQWPIVPNGRGGGLGFFAAESVSGHHCQGSSLGDPSAKVTPGFHSIPLSSEL
jgi:hypothetical protein